MEVGDLIKLKADEDVPADILILASQTTEKEGPTKEQGVVMVDTAQLDGETNLKMCQAIPETSQLYKNATRDGFGNEILSIQCEGPTKDLEKLNGQIDFANGNTKTICRSNFLLRGVKVKQTYQVFGIITHTGAETKIIKNNEGDPPKKRTAMDRLLNQCVLFCFIFTFSICLLMSILMGVWCSNHDGDWYLNLAASTIDDGLGYFKPDDAGTAGLLGFFTWVQLMCYMIPIPLYVTIEMIKLFTGNFMDWDIAMYNPAIDKTAKCRNSSVPEELGQVQYVLSDKTGTLTQNKMELLKFAAGGQKYGSGITEIEVARHGLEHPNDPPLVDTSADKPIFEHEDKGFRFYDPVVSGFSYLKPENEENAKNVTNFLLGLALCHEVVPEVNKDGTMKYNAASPDDGALVIGAKNLGYMLKSCDNAADGIGKEMIVSMATGSSDSPEHADESYVLLHTIGFTSLRKRMSNIFKMPDGNYRVYMKGADNFIYDRLTDDHKKSEAMKQTLKCIQTFGDDGLRTLLYSQKDVPASQFDAWNAKWEEALLIIDEAEREALCESLAPEMEEGHEPIGASAIEDKLQENVGETIQHLSDAGIQTWVLTGDKTNTAIMIGFACCLLKPSMERVIIKEDVMHEIEGGNFTKEGAGDRIAKTLLEAEAYYKGGMKVCPVKAAAGDVSVQVTKKWYRENKDWPDDGPTARDFDICEEEYKKIIEGGMVMFQQGTDYDKWLSHAVMDEEALAHSATKEGAVDSEGAPLMVPAYVLFDPIEHYQTGNLAMVIEGNALTQIGIGSKAIIIEEVPFSEELPNPNPNPNPNWRKCLSVKSSKRQVDATSA